MGPALHGMKEGGGLRRPTLSDLCDRATAAAVSAVVCLDSSSMVYFIRLYAASMHVLCQHVHRCRCRCQHRSRCRSMEEDMLVVLGSVGYCSGTGRAPLSVPLFQSLKRASESSIVLFGTAPCVEGWPIWGWRFRVVETWAEALSRPPGRLSCNMHMATCRHKPQVYISQACDRAAPPACACHGEHHTCQARMFCCDCANALFLRLAAEGHSGGHGVPGSSWRGCVDEAPP